MLRLHTFTHFAPSAPPLLPPPSRWHKKLPHIKNVREAFSVICYLALILAFGRLAFGIFSLIEKLAFGNVRGFISKPVDVQIVDV